MVVCFVFHFIASLISCLFDSNILIYPHQYWTLIFYDLLVICWHGRVIKWT